MSSKTYTYSLAGRARLYRTCAALPASGPQRKPSAAIAARVLPAGVPAPGARAASPASPPATRTAVVVCRSDDSPAGKNCRRQCLSLSRSAPAWSRRRKVRRCCGDVSPPAPVRRPTQPWPPICPPLNPQRECDITNGLAAGRNPAPAVCRSILALTPPRERRQRLGRRNELTSPRA
jgi:hypothetical protein